MTKLADIFDIDDRDIDSDWEDIEKMLLDIKVHVKTTGEEIFPMDDPGHNHTPPRSPRIGYSSESKCWTIRLTKAKLANEDIKKLLRTVNGRKDLLDWLNK